jgi:hypothetical protein
MQHFVKMLVV